MLGGAVAAARGRDFTSPLRQSPSPTAEPTGTSDGYSMTFDPPPTLFLGENGTFQFTSSGAGTVREYSLILLQLPVGDSNNAASSFKVLDVQTGRQFKPFPNVESPNMYRNLHHRRTWG